MRTRHALLALSLASLGAPAFAQGPRATVDLSTHVNARLRDAVHRLAECRDRAPGVALPSQLALEATVRGRAVVVVALDPSLPPAVRACVEQTASRSAAPRRDMALTQQQSVRVVVPFLLTAPPQPTTAQPTVPTVVVGPAASPQGPSLSPGQAVSIEWNGSFYPAQVLALEGGGVRVHYVGWDAIWDEVVPFARVQLSAGSAGASSASVVVPTPAYPTGPVIVPSTPGAPSAPAIPSTPVYVGPQQPAYMPPQQPAYVPPQQPAYVPPQQPTTYPQPVPAGRPNLVVNGSFEQPGLAPGSWNVFPAMPGWQSTAGGGIEVQNGVAGRSADGAHHVELDGHASTSIAQDIQTQAGMTYELRVSFAARPGTSAEDNVLLVLWNGQPVARLVADGSNDPDARWTTYTGWVTANGPRTRLELRDAGTSNSMGTYLDDVRLTATR